VFGGQVIRVSLDDFVEHPLGDQTVSAIEGAYSPDATKVVLVQGGTTLWVMDIDGGNPHQIDTQAALLTYPQWSPDGTRIAYGAVPTTSGQPAAIWIASPDGISKTNITPLADAEGPLEWSPDGSKIAFVSERTGDSDVFTMNPDGNSQFNVTNRTHDDGLDGTHWSPDGQQLTFTGFGSVWRIYADGSNAISLSGSAAQPTWGSNGLIYFIKPPDMASQLFVTNSNGTNQHALTTDTHLNYRPVLSPDATMIAWSKTESTGTHEQIWVANADGSNPVRVTNNTSDSSSPVWHPCTP
jgi:Tol biopolymer transport system component